MSWTPPPTPRNRQTQITVRPPSPPEKYSGFVHSGSTFAGMYHVLLIVFKVGGGGTNDNLRGPVLLHA